MRSIPAPAFLRVLRLLLPLVACGWGTVVASPIWSSPDDLVHLFAANPKEGFFLAIHSDGKVDRSVYQGVDTAMVVKKVRSSEVCITGVKSGLILCMHSNGNLYGSIAYIEEDCVFKFHMLENFSHVYESVKNNYLVSLAAVKGPMVSTWDLPEFSQFVHAKNEIDVSKLPKTG